MADSALSILVKFAALDRLTAPLRSITGASKRAGRDLAGTRKEILNLEKQAAKIGGFKDLQSAVSKDHEALDQARRRVIALKAAMQQADGPTGRLARSLEAAQNKVGRLTDKVAASSGRLGAMGKELRDAGVDTGHLSSEQERLAKALEKVNGDLDEQKEKAQRAAAAQAKIEKARATGDKLKSAGVRGLAVGVAIGAPVIGSAKSAMNLEEGMAGVAKVTGLAGAKLAVMQDKIVDLSTRIPMTAVELSNIAAAAGAAGVGMDKFGKPLPSQADDLVKFTDTAARMGIAFDMTAEDAGATMAKWSQAFHLPQGEVEALGDRVNALTNRFGGNASAVTDIITRIGPLGKVAGIAAPEIAAMGSTLNSLGIENEIASTGIKNTLLALTKGSAATKSQQKAFKALGLSSTDLAKRMQIDARGTIVDVFERLSKLKPEDQASALTNLFGSESVAAIAPMLTNLDGLKARFGLVGDKSQYAGSMTQEFNSRISTTKGATDIALNGLQAVNIQLGQALLPTVKLGAQRLAKFANATRQWAKENPVLSNALAIAAGAVALFTTALGVLGIVAGTVWPVLGKGWMVISRVGAAAVWASVRAWGLLSSLTALAAQGLAQGIATAFGVIRTAAILLGQGMMRAGLLMLANPMVLAIVALGIAIGVVGYLVYRNWDKIKAAFKTGWEWLKSFVPMFKNIGAMMLEGLLSMLSPTRLARHLWNLGKVAVSAFKGVLGIKSPSRVFAGLGTHMMTGLGIGIDRGGADPLARVRRVGTQLARAAAITVTGAGVASAAPAAAVPPGPPPAQGGDTYHIHVPAGAGADAKALARQVMEEIKRLKAAETRASYRDEDG